MTMIVHLKRRSILRHPAILWGLLLEVIETEQMTTSENTDVFGGPREAELRFKQKNAMCCTFLLCRVSVWFVMLFNEQCDFNSKHNNIKTNLFKSSKSRHGENRYNVEIDLFRRNNKKIQDIYDFTWGTNNKAQAKETGLWWQELAPGSARNLPRSWRRRDGKNF